MPYNWANSLQQIEPHVIKGLRIAKLIRVGSWVPRARKPARIAVLDKVSEQSRQIGDIWANNSSLTKKKSTTSESGTQGIEFGLQPECMNLLVEPFHTTLEANLI